MKLVLFTGAVIWFIIGCTVVLWSDDAELYQDTGIGDDQIDKAKLPKKIYEQTTRPD